MKNVNFDKVLIIILIMDGTSKRGNTPKKEIVESQAIKAKVTSYKFAHY
jgi:hypothetical protein